MMSCIVKSAALSALLVASVCPAFAGTQCETETSTEIVYITPETRVELDDGGEDGLISLLQSIADTQARDFSFTVAGGERGQVIANCGLGSRERSANWRNEFVIAPSFNQIGQFVHSVPEKGSALNIVSGLETASRFIRDETSTVIVLDAPLLFATENEAALSFERGIYPSDGVYFLPQTQHVFSILGRESMLSGAKVYLITGDEAYANAIHERALTRFWANYIHLMGGELFGVAKDASGIMDAALEGRKILRESFDPPDVEARPELLWAKPTELTLYELASEVDAAGQACNHVPAPEQLTKVRVLLRWDSPNVDLDVYVSDGGPELSYLHTASPEGEFFKMHEGGGKAGLRGFELVELSRTNPRDIRIGVNVYEVQGSVSGAITGTLRISFGEEESCLSIPVSFDVMSGNRGGGSRARLTSPHWRIIRLADAIG